MSTFFRWRGDLHAGLWTPEGKFMEFGAKGCFLVMVVMVMVLGSLNIP